MADPPDVIRRKFKTAVTDSGRDVRRAADKPGVTNLVEIMSVATGEPPEAIEDRYDGQGYGPFKADVAEAVVAMLEPVRLRYEELSSDPGELERLLRIGPLVLAPRARRGRARLASLLVRVPGL